jgi:hypothetical protein
VSLSALLAARLAAAYPEFRSWDSEAPAIVEDVFVEWLQTEGALILHAVGDGQDGSDIGAWLCNCREYVAALVVGVRGV